ncbi:MAG: hypothetical protein J6N52_10070 [Clostridia bacterium]|nr:hypothetical protein [Clostridia bacterium]
MNKRFISMISAVIMLSMLLCGLPSSAAAEGSISITADKAFVKKGEAVTFTISADSLSDMRGFQLGLSYDAEKLSYVKDSVSLTAGLFTDAGRFTESDGMLGFAFAVEEPVDYTGVIASFTMNVSDNCSDGVIGMSVSKLLAVDGSGNDTAVGYSIDEVCTVSEYNTEFSITPDKTELCTGDTVTYKISMSELELRGMQFAVEYDSSRYEFLKSEITGAYPIIKKDEGNKVGFVFYSKEDTAVSGELAAVTFRVKHIEGTNQSCMPIRISGFKAANASGVTDISYTVSQVPVSLLKSERVEIKFIPDKLMAGAGETISYTAYINGIENWRGLQTALKYDISKLELVSAEQLSVMAMADAAFETDVDGTVGLACVFSEAASTTGGELARLTFRVKENAADGYADMSVLRTKVSADGSGYIDADYYKEVEEVFVYGGQRAVISASPSVDIVIPGEVFEYSFMLSDVSDFKGMQFKLIFDSTILELVGITAGDVLDSAVVKAVKQTSDGVIQGMINYRDGYSGNGGLFTASFAAKSTAALIRPEIYFSEFTSDDYITYDIAPISLYPSEPAEEAINAISAIGEVDLSDRDLILHARKLYDALPLNLQSRVSNYPQLVDAEKKYEELYEALPVFECAAGDEAVKLTQNKPCDEKLTLYIAQYNAAGDMISVEGKEITGSADISYEKALTAAEVKCFIWNDSMQPYEDVLFSP